jgi:hypothetical protein
MNRILYYAITIPVVVLLMLAFGSASAVAGLISAICTGIIWHFQVNPLQFSETVNLFKAFGGWNLWLLLDAICLMPIGMLVYLAISNHFIAVKDGREGQFKFAVAFTGFFAITFLAGSYHAIIVMAKAF